MAEAADFGGFFAGFEQRLHAETDAEEGHAGLNALDEGFAYAESVEGAHHLAEVAHAGEQNFGGREQAGGIANQRVLAAEFAEGVLHAAQVAGAVVEDGDHRAWAGWAIDAEARRRGDKSAEKTDLTAEARGTEKSGRVLTRGKSRVFLVEERRGSRAHGVTDSQCLRGGRDSTRRRGGAEIRTRRKRI